VSSESIGVIAERYASALFELADDRGFLDEVGEDLQSLRAMIEDSADMRRLISSPVLTRAAQGRAVASVAEAAALNPITTNFLKLAARNRRLFALPAIIRSYLDRLAARRGHIDAEVASAIPLSDAQMDALAATLSATFGGEVGIDAKIDPSLLGGLVVKVGSRMVDSSLKTKLQHLKFAMKGVG
jgi:F-type H+-transporting ATPase subunit delta